MNIFKKEKERKIPPKNYIYLVTVLLGTVLILVYMYKWYDTYRESKLNTSIMNNYLTVINYNELSNYITENKNAVIYVSILGDEKINRFENSFKNTITRNNLRNSMLYLDVTNENIVEVKNNLRIDTEFPCIVVYTNGEISDTYSIVRAKYNSKKIIKYLNRIGVNRD
ncbi:MAG: hypothetical protein IKF19_00420 [Bacilli bacterium]|nr:hypothetical protein [Bacilli bacterium]